MTSSCILISRHDLVLSFIGIYFWSKLVSMSKYEVLWEPPKDYNYFDEFGIDNQWLCFPILIPLFRLLLVKVWAVK